MITNLYRNIKYSNDHELYMDGADG